MLMRRQRRLRNEAMRASRRASADVQPERTQQQPPPPQAQPSRQDARANKRRDKEKGPRNKMRSSVSGVGPSEDLSLDVVEEVSNVQHMRQQMTLLLFCRICRPLSPGGAVATRRRMRGCGARDRLAYPADTSRK